MADRGRRRSRTGRRGNWQPDQFDPLPRRNRARKRIEPEKAPPLPPLVPRGRKLSGSEREQLRERYTERRTPPLPARRVTRQKQGSRWWTKASVIGLFAILFGSIGVGRYFGGATATPDSTATATATATARALAARPTIAIVLLTPTNTPTLTPTPSPTPTPTPSPTPTPDPRFVGKVICLDPGHGGTDRGITREATAGGPAMEEANVTLQLALALRPRLESLGFTVVMTRDTDTDVNADFGDANGDSLTYDYWKTRDPAKAERVKDVDELQARILVCDAANADLLISMHVNGFPSDPSVNGYETWFSSARPFTPLNQRFAQIMFDQLGEWLPPAGYNGRARGVNDDAQANIQFSGDVFDRFVITGPAQPGQIVPSDMPGSIVETGFLSNDDDAAFLASPEGQEAIVTAYERAVAEYFTETGG